MDSVILLLIVMVIFMCGVLLYLGRYKSPIKKEPNQERPRQAHNLNNNPNIQRNRLRNRNHQNRNIDIVEGDNNNFIDDDEVARNDSDEDALYDENDREELRRKIGTKKLAKLESKAAKREANEQMIREREEKKEVQEKLYYERKKKEEEEERLEKERELIESKIKEEQEKREYDEYLKLKQEFSIEEEGHDVETFSDNSSNLLNQFVDFIKKSKIVVLEDLAADFKLKTQDVINRINQVQEMGLITGVMDDRGKFIYISEDELLKVKKFIDQRGRISLSELASNQLISLKPIVNDNFEL